MLSLPKAILQWVAACLCLFLLVLYLTSDWTSYRSLHLPSYTLSKNDYYDLVNDSTAFQSFLPGSNEITPYPSLFPLGELLQDWHPLHTHLQAFSRSKAHPSRKAGLYRFNFQDPAQLQMAFEMRDKDLPFVIYNVPSLDNAAMHAFSHVNLLEEIGSSQFVVEESNCNEFTYYFVKNEQVVRARFPTWSAPQTSLSMTFMDYVHLAEEKESSHKASQFNEKYHYLTISAEKEGNLAWIADSLRLFDPVDSLFMNSQEPYRGIKCRLGMKGVIATAHFDSKKNFVAMVRGQKRYEYILCLLWC
ncbi:hypothetical protein EON65_19665 [archaeon]|nr:MAG: hypothetical protein EON65_19665 [archaeon]